MLLFIFSCCSLWRISSNENYNFIICFLIWNKKRISKSIFHFSILSITWKNKNRKQFFFLIYFDLKPVSKNKNQNFRIHFLIWNQAMSFKKFVRFSILVMKLKNEKWKNFKIHFVFKSKNELYFRYTDFFMLHVSTLV